MSIFFFLLQSAKIVQNAHILCVPVLRERERERDLIPLLGLGSTRSDKGTDAGEESAKLAALCPLVKEEREELEATLAST